MEESFSKEWQDNKSDPSLSERENPLKLLKSINKTQFITFFVTYLSWTFVSFDYFIVTFTLPYIAKDFKLKPSDVAVSITLMLTFRPLASGFAPNFLTYSITRAIFGMAMGGEWGLGAALAMEALPLESRGLLSGILQEGYALGFLLAAYQNQKNGKDCMQNVKQLKLIHVKKLVHGSKDLYPTFLNVQLDFTPGQITFITIIANIGSIIGGFINGYICHFLGRKNAMITFTFLAGCFLPLYVLPRNYIVLTIGAFAVYLCIGGSWGSIPAYLNEIAPVELRGTFPGLVYQTGTLLASSSAQIEAFFGEMIKEEGSPDYGLTIALLTSLFVIVIIIILKFTNNV
ncbi:unnamed protein product [Rhizophagus irregularis]|nr:unnamed protein product [Rhizophagus irregularis]